MSSNVKLNALHRLCEKVQSMFNELDILVKHCKINFIKSPNHKSDWKQYSDLTLPPQAKVNQWGNWIVAVLWFAEHIDAFQTFVNALNIEVFLAIEDA